VFCFNFAGTRPTYGPEGHGITLDEIDLTDLDFFVHGDPQAAFRLLRAEAPVYWHERKPGQRFWAVSSYEDALKVYHDPMTFSSERGISL
jgi:cytochrome P450